MTKRNILILGACLSLSITVRSMLEKKGFNVFKVEESEYVGRSKGFTFTFEDNRPTYLEALIDSKQQIIKDLKFKEQRRTFENITFRKKNNFRPRFNRTKN